jgi:chemotaxis response regulator CheB
MNKIRVLVVDDSALMRKLIPQMLAGDDSIEVVGTAMDGSFCLKKIDELKPNVVTLDLEMPGMNGIDTLKEIMRRQPVPVIVFSSHSTEGATNYNRLTLEVIGNALPGQPFPSAVPSGQTVRIMTGAPIPAGCDRERAN